MSRLGGARGEARCAGVKGSGTMVETSLHQDSLKSAKIFEPTVQGRV